MALTLAENWLAGSNQPLKAVDEPTFRALMDHISGGRFQSVTAASLKRHLLQRMKPAVDQLKVFYKDRHVILTSDGWTKSKYETVESFGCVTAHAIERVAVADSTTDEEVWTLHSNAIGFVGLNEHQNAVNVAANIDDLCERYSIAEPVGMVTDSTCQIQAAVAELQLENPLCIDRRMHTALQNALENCTPCYEGIEKLRDMASFIQHYPKTFSAPETITESDDGDCALLELTLEHTARWLTLCDMVMDVLAAQQDIRTLQAQLASGDCADRESLWNQFLTDEEWNILKQISLVLRMAVSVLQQGDGGSDCFVTSAVAYHWLGVVETQLENNTVGEIWAKFGPRLQRQAQHPMRISAASSQLWQTSAKRTRKRYVSTAVQYRL
eukprot:TRINITY_DN5441_c0_g1_i1.p1 TRINITY_DN5441_c0_g1~~TRINITY_DN5441_c0_g1_i1.p1  ORF type:complete len:445 (+),score=87.91 TRINITY_DN5441_c0_g1_i1:189-1337(+)